MSIAIDKARKIFADNLKYYLELRGKTQKDLVELLGCSKSAVSQWVNGKRSMPAAVGQQIAEYLGVSLDVLCTERRPITTEELKILLFDTAEIDDERLNEVLRYAKYVKDK